MKLLAQNHKDTTLRRGTRYSILATLLLAVLFSTPAQADQLEVRDETDDIWSPEGPRWEPANTAPNVDLRKTLVANGVHAVAIEARYTDLRRGDDEFELRIDIKGPTGAWTVSAQVDPIVPNGYFILQKLRSGRVVECDVTGRVRYGADNLRVSVPRECLANPSWIRIRGHSESFNEETGRRVDDVRTSTAESPGWSTKVRIRQNSAASVEG